MSDLIKNAVDELKNDLVKISEDSKDDKEMFLSECDFQLHLAQKLKDNGFNVILEYPIKATELYKFKKNTTDNSVDSNSYIDIFCQKDDKTYFIELKYKTVEEKVQRYGTEFTLKDHNCHTDNRKDVYKDIERLECCKKWYKSKKGKDCEGYIIFLTNYHKHHHSF